LAQPKLRKIKYLQKALSRKKIINGKLNKLFKTVFHVWDSNRIFSWQKDLPNPTYHYFKSANRNMLQRTNNLTGP